MRARDLARPFPIVTPDTEAMVAAQAMARERLPGLIVCDADGRPYTILPGSQVLRFVIPGFIQDDPPLARALNDEASAELCRPLTHSTVRDLLPRARDLHDLPVVAGDATTLEVAAVMARMHSPLVAVVDGDRVVGAIIVSRLLDDILPTTRSPDTGTNAAATGPVAGTPSASDPTPLTGEKPGTSAGQATAPGELDRTDPTAPDAAPGGPDSGKSTSPDPAAPTGTASL